MFTTRTYRLIGLNNLNPQSVLPINRNVKKISPSLQSRHQLLYPSRRVVIGQHQIEAIHAAVAVEVGGLVAHAEGLGHGGYLLHMANG